MLFWAEKGISLTLEPEPDNAGVGSYTYHSNLGSLLMKGLTMNIKLLLFIFLLPHVGIAQEKLKIFTYGSFNSDWGPGPNIQKEFEQICDCDLVWSTAYSSGALLSWVKLTNNKEGYDLILGLDDSLITEAKKVIYS